MWLEFKIQIFRRASPAVSYGNNPSPGISRKNMKRFKRKEISSKGCWHNSPIGYELLGCGGILYFAFRQYFELQHPPGVHQRRQKVPRDHLCVANDSVGNLELFICRLHKNGLSNLAVLAGIVLNCDESHEDSESHTMKPSSYFRSLAFSSP